MAFLGSLIETVGNVLTGSQNASVEAARIAADTNDKREQRDHEVNKLIMNTTKEQMKQAQENLRESNKAFKDTIESMQATAREMDEAQRRQMAELLKEQAEKEKAMSDATIEERQAMRKEFIQARQEKEEEMRRIREENLAQISEATRQHREKMNEMQEEVKRLNELRLETVQDCSNMMLEQSEKQRVEINELNDARIRDQKENAEKIDELHDREIGLTRGFAAAMINMTISQANSRETATIVELSNSLRDSLSETRTLHHNAVETAQIAMNNYDFTPASIQFGSLGQRIDQVDTRRAEFVRALNRANTANKQLIAQQMQAIGQLELALSVYRTAVGSLRSKMTSTMPDISQSDINEFNAIQLELTKRMIEMPLIDANDVYGEIATNAQKALGGPTIRALEQ